MRPTDADRVARQSLWLQPAAADGQKERRGGKQETVRDLGHPGD